MENSKFQENDLVWAKLGNYIYWPAIVMKPHPEAPQKPPFNSQWVYFMDSHNYGWVLESKIKPYEQYKAKYERKKVQQAMEEIEAISKGGPDYKIDFVEYAARKPRSSRKTMARSDTPASSRGLSTPRSRKRSRPSSALSNKSTKRAKNISESTDYSNVDLGSSWKSIGFLAGNAYCEGIIKNLISEGYHLCLWTRSSGMRRKLKTYAQKHQFFFQVCRTSVQVVQNSNIVFSCLSGPQEAREVIGSVKDDLDGKCYVEMTSIDPDTSKEFNEIVTSNEGCYLEAMLQGNKGESNKGEMVILAAGSEELYSMCQCYFEVMAKACFFLGPVGSACKIHLLFQVMKGVFVTSLVEGFALAERCNITLKAFNNVFKTTQMSSEYLQSKSDTIVQNRLGASEEPLKQLQEDLACGLEMSNKYRQPMPLASNANEVMKHFRRLGYHEQDFACVYRKAP